MYPQRPDFSSGEPSATWWKVNNPLARRAYVCSTNGPGFITEIKRYIYLMINGEDASGTGSLDVQGGSRTIMAIGISLQAMQALFGLFGNEAISKPDASGRLMLTNGNIGASGINVLARINTKWTETTVAFLAAWFRRANDGNARGSTYRDLMGSMPAWAQDAHRGLRDEFAAHRIGIHTLKVAAWFATIMRDFTADGRMGGGGDVSVGPQFSEYRDIAVDSSAAPPAWDAELSGGVQQIGCRELLGNASLAPPSTTIQWEPPPDPAGLNVSALRRLPPSGWAKLAAVGVLAGFAGWTAFRRNWI